MSFFDYSIEYACTGGGTPVSTKGLTPETKNVGGDEYSMLMGELLCTAERLAPAEAMHIVVYGYRSANDRVGQILVESWRSASGEWEGRDYEMYREYWE